MKGFFQRLFGGDGPNDKKVVRSESASPLGSEPFSHGLVRIQSLDFFGAHTTSPNGRIHLIWLDRNPEGTIGVHRYEGHGAWTLLRFWPQAVSIDRRMVMWPTTARSSSTIEWSPLRLPC